MAGIRNQVVAVHGGAGIHKWLSVEGGAKIDVAAYLSTDLNAIMQEDSKILSRYMDHYDGPRKLDQEIR